jgi:hypothetical protein
MLDRRPAEAKLMSVMRRVLGILAAAGLVALVAAAVFARDDDGPAAVLGEKVVRCTAGDGSVVPSGVRQIAADDEPFTIRVESGRIASILTKPLKITPDTVPVVQPASVAIASIRIEGSALVADMIVSNGTSCSAVVSRAGAVSRRGPSPSRVANVRFGASNGVVVAPGAHATGRFSVPLEGDGTYEISASATTEIGRVR